MLHPDITWRMGGFFLVPDYGLYKHFLLFDFHRSTPEVVTMHILHRGTIAATWILSREVLRNAVFNRETSGDPAGDFIIEPFENVREDLPMLTELLEDTMLCHMSTNSSVDPNTGTEFAAEIHEHLVFSRSGLEAFLKETDTLVPPQNEDLSVYVDRLLADIFQ